MRISSLAKQAAAIVTIALLIAPSSSYAAVRLGMHMDFVLSSGATVRVFPAADTAGVAGERPAWQPAPAASTSVAPAQQNLCTRVDTAITQVNAGTSRAAQFQRVAQLAELNAGARPSWLRSTSALRSVVGSTAVRAMTKPSSWYYLPTAPRLSFREGKPEAMFVNFITDETTEQGGAEGGLFHLMVTYGLTQAEETELRTELQKVVEGAVLRGQVDLLPSGNNQNFIVTSGTLSDTGFAPAGVLTSGFAPTLPGGKAAMAGRLSAQGAQLLAKTFDNANGTSDLSVTFVYDYIAKTRAFTGEVTIDLDQVNEVTNCFRQNRVTNRRRSGIFGLSTEPAMVTDEQWKEDYDILRTVGAVQTRFDVNMPEVDVSTIESALMQTAMESFLNMQRQFQTTPVEMPAADEDEDNDTASVPQVDNYRVYRASKKTRRMTGRLTYRVTKELAVYRNHVITGNMGAELRRYRDGVFSSVLLNDPFFKRGELLVSIDPEAFPLFETQQINNATVMINVPLAGSTPFTDQAAFFARDVVGAADAFKTFTFATNGRGSPDPACIVKYKASWSLRGGGQWPRTPAEVCSNQLAITLTPPLAPRTIDVEADLGELESVGIRAADVVLRHTRYGRPTDETVKFRVAEGVGYRSATLFIDKSESAPLPPVEYSIVFTHKDAGPLPATPFRRLDGDFVIANVSGLPATYLRDISGTVEAIRSFLE
jgi:hypothetical protein